MATLTMSSTFMIETPFMSSELKPPKSSVCVAGGARSNTFTLVFFSCTRRPGGSVMAKFLVEATYTAEGLKGLIKDTASGRKAAVVQALADVGGKLEAIYFDRH